MATGNNQDPQRDAHLEELQHPSAEATKDVSGLAIAGATDAPTGAETVEADDTIESTAHIVNFAHRKDPYPRHSLRDLLQTIADGHEIKPLGFKDKAFIMPDYPVVYQNPDQTVEGKLLNEYPYRSYETDIHVPLDHKLPTGKYTNYMPSTGHAVDGESVSTGEVDSPPQDILSNTDDFATRLEQIMERINKRSDEARFPTHLPDTDGYPLFHPFLSHPRTAGKINFPHEVTHEVGVEYSVEGESKMTDAITEMPPKDLYDTPGEWQSYAPHLPYSPNVVDSDGQPRFAVPPRRKNRSTQQEDGSYDITQLPPADDISKG
jgi:hypothetical protein